MNLIEIKKKIYGDILVSDNIGKALRKWREIFKISQSQLAREMSITSSVVSDYEGGRQKYPGTKFIRRYVETLIKIDMKRGENVLRMLAGGEASINGKSILDICEYPEPVPARKIIDVTESEVLVNDNMLNAPIYGHTVLDSIISILTLSGSSFYCIYGSSSERALIFTKVSMGRSPMVAVRVYPLKPRVVILHGPSRVDELAKKIAERERIILALSHATTIKKLLKGLETFKVKSKLST
ncbi:transcriptional regulator [Candidatus Geothermarchaeota archaeon]|nr:MAG: transcriptional regulator [Candidatus Geothermarchaeota archaeon]